MASPLVPGRAWLDIVEAPTFAAFATAFSAAPELSASVLDAPIVGVARLHAFFAATRAMYDRIVFTRETHGDHRTILEWAGRYRSAPIAGVTILEPDPDGAICSVRVFHLPHCQVVALADDLADRLHDHPSPTGSSSCA